MADTKSWSKFLCSGFLFRISEYLLRNSLALKTSNLGKFPHSRDGIFPSTAWEKGKLERAKHFIPQAIKQTPTWC